MREVGALEPNLPDCARVRSGKVRWRADSVYRLEPLAGARCDPETQDPMR